jgi:hypothetical protein
MRRWFCLFLLVCFPLQLSWAVAATYCQHEQGPGAQHFGHHQHQHQTSHQHAPAGDAVIGDAALQADAHQHGQDVPKLSIDGDCAFCHLGSLQPPAAALPPLLAMPGHALVPHAPWPLASHVPDGLERPDRRFAA